MSAAYDVGLLALLLVLVWSLLAFRSARPCPRGCTWCEANRRRLSKGGRR